MKKKYEQPITNFVQLSSEYFLQAISASGSLSGTSYGGTTSEGGITTANTKSSNMWDDEIGE